jgi:hypothetical protein
MATKLQIRRDTAANWTSANPTLSAGEFGYETDTYKLKIGDGSTAWTSLDYYADQLAGGLDSSEIVGLLSNGSVGHIIPAGNELYDLGDSANRFRDLYLSGSTLNLGGVTLSVDSGGTLTLPEGTRVGSIRVLDSADVAEIAGSISGLDSTGVSNLIDAAYIQSRQITYNTNDFADSAFVTSQINALIDGAPGTLDTLNEIAAALNDDDSAYNTLLSLINAKTDYDSADTLGLIDSAYIQARQTTASSGVDSAAVTNLIDSAYIQARHTAGGGGTGGSLTAVASGALSDGTIVVVNSDGTVSAASQVVTASNSSPVTFYSGDTNELSAAYDANAQKVVVTYQDANASNYLKAVVGTVSGSTISFGSPVTFYSGNGLQTKCVYDANSQKIVVAYNAQYNGYGIVGTVSGTSISFGAPTAFDNSGYASSFDMAYDENAQKVVITYRNYNSGNPGLAIVGTVSGTSISFGSAAQFTSNVSSQNSTISYNAAAQKVVIGYNDANSSNRATAIVGTVSGTSISFGSAVQLTSTNNTYTPQSVYDANAQKTVFFHSNASNNGVDAVVATVSGSSISLGTPVTVQINWYSLPFASFVYDPGAQKIVALYYNGYDRSGSGTGTSIIVGTVSGTSISFDVPTYIEDGSGYTFNEMSSIVYDASAQKIVSVFDRSGSSGEGKAVVSQLGYTSANLTAENYIGISDGAYSDGDSATIQITGSVDDAQTGLTAGQTYYVQSDGTLATTPDTISVIAGTAVSSTKLLIRADQDTISSGLDSASTIALIDSAYIQARQTDIYRDSAFVTGIVDSAYIQARQTSGGSGGLDSAATINNNTNSGFFKYKYTATSGQTVFADSDANGNVMSFDPNSTLVFYNGVLLDETTDYEASSNTVTLTSGADAGVSITVAKYGVGYTPPPYPWGGDRALTGGGNIASTSPYHSNVIDYFDITTAGNATDFGDMTKLAQSLTGVSNGTRAVFIGGGSGDGSGSLNYSNSMDYVTIASPSNASDFGDLSVAVTYCTGDNKADGTYGLASGFRTSGGNVNNIEYITIATTSNTTDFGDLTQARTHSAACSDGTYAIMTGGMDGSSNLFNIIDYVTIASPSNASDFGDLLAARVDQAAVSSTTIGLIGGGRNSSYDLPIGMEYVMIATPGNAAAAGDLFNASNSYAAGASSNGTYGTWNGGGYISDLIQRVTISTSGNASDFADLTVGRSNAAGTSGNAA